MTLEVLITRDYDHMSETATGLLIPKMAKATMEGEGHFNLGLATGNTQLGLQNIMVERQGEFYTTKIKTWNLDEYVGLPPDHPESYTYQMEQNLFGRLNPRFLETHIPEGGEIDQDRLERALEVVNHDHIEINGAGSGKAITIN